ncbi:FG-GAP repeat domain-containing protein, partial [Serratia marcescens]|uniref:FG-GAP repeat domain-containing protein n=1 Tax=Serratia marcescens TaxID=615 RepID=UPI0013DB6DCA
FMAYRQHAVASASLEEILNQLPKVQIPNYVFKNNGDLSFTNKSTEWGFTKPTFSAGMAYADFDRDG